ncbi:MAG: tetratricopeptide repeat protein [Proteobacteria bacterium]|nr:tetratricopeptide repeat protein [Pseudomonadota bacterium]
MGGSTQRGHRVRGAWPILAGGASHARSTALCRKARSPTIGSGAVYTNLGFLYGGRKEYRSAADMFERAVASGRQITPGSMRLANRLADLGSAQRLLGRQHVARRSLQEALEIQRRLAPGSLDEAQTQLLLAQIERDAGRLEAARAGFETASQIFHKLAGGTLHELEPRRELGETLTALGMVRAARIELAAALALAAQYVPQTGEHAAALYALGRLERREGHTDIAERLFREALRALEVQYGLLGGNTLTSASFSAAFEPLYKDLADILIERGEDDEALELLERFRQRSLRERIDALHFIEIAEAS